MWRYQEQEPRYQDNAGGERVSVAESKVVKQTGSGTGKNHSLLSVRNLDSSDLFVFRLIGEGRGGEGDRREQAVCRIPYVLPLSCSSSSLDLCLPGMAVRRCMTGH